MAHERSTRDPLVKGTTDLPADIEVAKELRHFAPRDRMKGLSQPTVAGRRRNSVMLPSTKEKWGIYFVMHLGAAQFTHTHISTTPRSAVASSIVSLVEEVGVATTAQESCVPRGPHETQDNSVACFRHKS